MTTFFPGIKENWNNKSTLITVGKLSKRQKSEKLLAGFLRRLFATQIQACGQTDTDGRIT